MNIRHGLAGLTLALGTLASVPAFAQSYYAPNTYPAVPPPATVVVQPAAPAIVAPQPAPYYADRGAVVRARMRMNRIDQQVRAGVAAGRVHPQALQALDQQKARVEFVLARVTRDGAIMPQERRRLDAMLDRMETIDDQYRLRRGGMRVGWRVSAR